jgi:hypothetical protein
MDKGAKEPEQHEQKKRKAYEDKQHRIKLHSDRTIMP